MKKALATLLVILATSCISAHAQEKANFDETAWKVEFSAADKDGDGKLSRDEAKAANSNITDEVFDKIDTNGDGFISPEEDKAMLE